MSLVVTGLNHRTSDLALREKMAFSEQTLPKALADLRGRFDEGGCVIVSTCNRSEIYAHHPAEPEDIHSEIRRFLSEWHALPDDTFNSALYEHHGKEAVGHLFRVVSSLDSMVVGEGQILGQVHDAYILAHSEQVTDKVINTAFQKAFTVAKRVRSQTKIGAGKVSISSIAVDLAVSIFMDLSGKTAMVIGSGEMSELTLKSLVGHGVGRVLVANRSIDKAQRLAEQYDGEAIDLAHLDVHLPRADIVISSTGAPGVLLRTAHFQQALRERNKQPMFVIDIAVPRDVEAAVNQLDNVYLYNLDDLQEMADKNIEARRTEMDRCLAIVDEGVEQFWRWTQRLVAQPTIVSLSEELHAIRERELKKTLAQLPDLTEAQREEVAYLTKRIVNNVLHQPLKQLKHEADAEDPKGVLQVVRRLFGLKEST